MAHTVDNQNFETTLPLDTNGLRENLQAEVRLVNEYVQHLFTICQHISLNSVCRENIIPRTESFLFADLRKAPESGQVSRTVVDRGIWRHRCKLQYFAVVTDCGQFVKRMVYKRTCP